MPNPFVPPVGFGYFDQPDQGYPPELGPQPQPEQQLQDFLPLTTDPNYGAPQEATPSDFWARLAQGSGSHPFGQPTVPNKPTGLEVLLAIAQGFGNAKANQGAQRVDATTQRNMQAREAAKTLATWRHDERKAMMAKNDRKAELATNEQFRRDKMAQEAANAALNRGDQQEWRRIMEGIYRDRINAANLRSGLGGGAGGSGAGGAAPALGGEDKAAVWAKKLSTSEAKISNVPMPLRTRAVELAGTILPDKARNTIQEINAARGVLMQLRIINDRILSHRGEGIQRLKSGSALTAEAFKQSPGLGEDAAEYERQKESMLAILSRAKGERGVLTEQDTGRAKKGVPDLFTSRGLSVRMLDDTDKYFDRLVERTIKTYTTPMGGIGSGGASPTTTPDTTASGGMSDDAAYQLYLQTVGGKK